jgi:hypothetical protein
VKSYLNFSSKVQALFILYTFTGASEEPVKAKDLLAGFFTMLQLVL